MPSLLNSLCLSYTMVHDHTPIVSHTQHYMSHTFKTSPAQKAYPRLYYPASIRLRYVSCMCVCYGRLLPSFQAWLIGAWCSVDTYTFANIQMYIQCVNIVWVCYIQPSQLQTLRVIDFMLSGLSLLCCSPSDRLAAVRIEGIKGEVTVMSKAACFYLSELRTSKHVTQMIVESEDTCFTGQGGGG